MPPRRKQKSAEQKKEDAERQKKILSTKEKVLSIKRMLLSLIEVMIEKDVSKDWFLANCTKLCHADYEDVIQERSIENLCGYPLCSNLIKKTLRQKYHISRVTNKVYDLTERKCFCSNECYKASNYLRAQLSPIPLYMRKEESIKLHLLSDCDNMGSIGEEIVFHPSITVSPNEIDGVCNKEETSNNLKNMLHEEIKKCADSLGDLKIKEHTFENQFVFCEETPKNSHNSPVEEKKESDSEAEDDSDDSLDENFFPICENVSVLDQRHMPIPEKIKKTVLISAPITPTANSFPVQQLSLESIINAFKDWMTEDSFKYLLGEKYVYGVKAEHLFQQMTSTEPLSPEKLSSIKNEYIKLSLKIDSLPDDDSDINDSFELDLGNESSLNTSSQKPKANNSAKKVFIRRPRKKSNDTKKHVTFSQDAKSPDEPAEKKTEVVSKERVETASDGNDKTEAENKEKNVTENETNTKVVAKEKVDSKNEKQIEQVDEKIGPSVDGDLEEERPTECQVPEPLFPLVDSVSQNALRKKLLINNLKSAYTELLPIIGLHYTDIREAVRKFVDTLSLTPTNITFKPKEWKLISVILFRMLTRTVLQDIYDEFQLLKLYEDPTIPVVIDLIEIEKTVSHIISVKNIINIQ